MSLLFMLSLFVRFYLHIVYIVYIVHCIHCTLCSTQLKTVHRDRKKGLVDVCVVNVVQLV